MKPNFYRTLLILSGALFFIPQNSVASSAAMKFSKNAILIDAGSTNILSPGALPLEADTRYNKDTGYGWISGPKRQSLLRKNLSRSRNKLTIDSISAQKLKFRIDLAPGDWQVTFWMESGMEHQNSALFLINGKARNLNWHIFGAPAEPKVSLNPSYRLYMGNVTVGKKGLVLEWRGKADLVRLNGLQFHSRPTKIKNLQKIKKTSVQTALRLKEAGRFDSIVSLEAIMADLNNPSDTYATYWRHQLSVLAKAEEYFEGMRGWEWARKKTGLSMFGRYNQAIMLIDGLLADADDSHPLYERALYQRGRLLYWRDREGHGNNYDGVAPHELVNLYKRHPDSLLLAMYANEKIDTPDSCDNLSSPPNAPAWSIAQNEVLCRTRLLSGWWIKNRQDDNGELGGKYGDDVEMLRWWTIPFLSGDATTSRGWRKLATGVWHSDRLEQGYYKKPSDVEHASEPISDTAPLLAFLDEPEYIDRLAYSANHFLKRWTVLNDQGRRYFRSAWFGALTMDERPPRNRDIPMNGRAAKAVYYYAWSTQDKVIIDALHQWAKGWAYGAMSTAKGKPAGLIPASIRAHDEAINGDEPTWYVANMFWDYYDWDHEKGQQIYDMLLFMSQMTGDKSLLEPMFSSADLVEKFLSADHTKNFAKGSAEWAIKRLSEEPAFWSVLEQWRLLNNDNRYDALLNKHGGPYIKYRLTGNKNYLAPAAEPILETIRYNFAMRTREALFTDRVYITRTDGGMDPRPQILGMLTGGMLTSSPYADISWQDTPQGFTALVSKASKSTLEIETYLFSDAEKEIAFRLWRLEPGKYRMTLLHKGKETYSQNINLKKRGQKISLVIKPATEYRLTLQRTGPSASDH